MSTFFLIPRLAKLHVHKIVAIPFRAAPAYTYIRSHAHGYPDWNYLKLLCTYVDESDCMV